ncbi:MAG TPA: HAD hydrolase-like protein [Longimicrobium sp.]|jgi:phosphoglycolate phosphatase
MTKYRLAIFDFDGTLADSFPWFLGVVNEAADRYRFRRMEGDEAEALRGHDARHVMAHVALPAWKLPLVARWMRRRMARDIASISLFPGVGEMLHRLSSKGMVIAVVSSNSAANVRRVLGPANAALVRHYGCGASLFGKRAKLRRVLRESGVPAAAALCIGDEIRDLHAARAEGIAFGAVAWGYTRADALAAHAPDERFATVDEIAERLARPTAVPV